MGARARAIFATLVGVSSVLGGCGLVLDLDPTDAGPAPGADGAQGRDGGGASLDAAVEDAGMADGDVGRRDGSTGDGAVLADAGATDSSMPLDGGSCDGGSARVDGGVCAVFVDCECATVNVLYDSNNCGGCGITCEAERSCCDGACVEFCSGPC